MSELTARPWPPKIAQLIEALAQPLTSPTPAAWAKALEVALGREALAYLVAVAVKLRAAGLGTELQRITEVAVHLVGDGKLPDAFEQATAKADENATTRTTEGALGKPKKNRGVGLRR